MIWQSRPQFSLGTVTSLATVTIRSQISGYLLKIDFKEGDEVKKGDLLAQINSRPYEAAFNQAKEAVARDEALLKGAQVDLTRYQVWRRKMRSTPDAGHPDSAGRAGPGHEWKPTAPRSNATNKNLNSSRFSRRWTAASGCARSIRATMSRPATPTASW